MNRIFAPLRASPRLGPIRTRATTFSPAQTRWMSTARPSDNLSTAAKTFGLAALAGTLMGAGIIIGGAPPEVGMPDVHKDKQWGVAHFHRVKDSFDIAMEEQLVPFSDKLLPDELPAPMQPKYTLVVDLTDTLITYVYKNNRQVPLIRPGTKLFLSYLSQYYEIVIYTAQPGAFANDIIDRLDPVPQGYSTISYRLYRDATRYVDGNFCKDLKSLNRDIKRVICVDDNADDCKQDLDNCIVIKPWDGDPNDTVLTDLIPLLEFMAQSDLEDVRDVIKRYKGTDMVAAFHKNRKDAQERYQQELLQKQKQEEPDRRRPLFGRR